MLFVWDLQKSTVMLFIPFASLRTAATSYFAGMLVCTPLPCPCLRAAATNYFAGTLVCTPLLRPFRSHAFVPLRHRWYAGF
ncbi:hypothetical protein R3P38DRAFT_2915047 [Favolaschia claudopus]|uniref:Secreted protein n=1 Tax=Favolaschia claudopus TaxID=2862362 RepID=A0AAW0C4B3_9AGAR